jgi:aldehyde dehydrogenase (NAD+)
MRSPAQMTDLLPDVSAFLASGPLPMFIGGKWMDAADGGRFISFDPGTGEALVEVAEGTARDVHRAVQAATKVFRQSDWATMREDARSAILRRLADLVDAQTPALAQLESLDTGKPLAQAAKFDVPNVAHTLRCFVDLALQTGLRKPLTAAGGESYWMRLPYGVCAFVLPWNYPLLLLGWAISPALAAGNTVVLKPSQETPLTSLYFCRLAEEAGIPEGVINVVPGPGETAGAALASHPGIQRMGFIGSAESAKKIAAICGANLIPLKLTLGVKGTAMIFDDVDVGRTAAALTGAIAMNSGQACCTAARWLIHQRIAEQLIGQVTENLSRLSIGHGLDPHTDMGPVVSQKQMDRVLGYIDRGIKEGARTEFEGGPAQVVETPKGFYVKPCLLSGREDNICFREEILGPVVYIRRFREEQEAAALVNDAPLAMANSVWTRDPHRARRMAETMAGGTSWINPFALCQPAPAYSGSTSAWLGGVAPGPEALLEYLRPRSIVGG